MSAALVRDCLAECHGSLTRPAVKLTQEDLDEFMREHNRQVVKIYTDLFDNNPHIFNPEDRKYNAVLNEKFITEIVCGTRSAQIVVEPLTPILELPGWSFSSQRKSC